MLMGIDHDQSSYTEEAGSGQVRAHSNTLSRGCINSHLAGVGRAMV